MPLGDLCRNGISLAFHEGSISYVVPAAYMCGNRVIDKISSESFHRGSCSPWTDRFMAQFGAWAITPPLHGSRAEGTVCAGVIWCICSTVVESQLIWLSNSGRPHRMLISAAYFLPENFFGLMSRCCSAFDFVRPWRGAILRQGKSAEAATAPCLLSLEKRKKTRNWSTRLRERINHPDGSLGEKLFRSFRW